MRPTVRQATSAAVSLLLAACGGGSRPAPYRLEASTPQVTLRTQAGRAAPAEAVVDLTTVGGTAAAPPLAAVAYPGEAGWLAVSVAPLGAGWRATLGAAGAALGPGHREATVTFTSPGAAGPVQVAVALEVDPAPVLAVSSHAAAFGAEQGGAAPADQVLEVTLADGGGAVPALEVRHAEAGAAWLSASLAGAGGAWTLTLSASPAGLAPGVHEAAVVLTSAGATGSPAEVAVAFTITPPPGTLAVAPDALRFSAAEGTRPAAQRLTAFVSTPEALATTTVAVAPADALWLAATPVAAGGLLEVDVHPDPAGLAPGTYQAALVVESPGLTGSPATVPVTLTVTPAVPLLAVDPPALQFDAPFSNPPAAQVVAVTGTGPGILPPVAAEVAYVEGGGWLSVTAGGAGNAQTLTIRPTPSALKPALLHAHVTVSADGAAGSPATVEVALQILAATGSRCPPGSTLRYQGGGGAGGEPADFASTFFANYCTRCHDSAKVGLARGGAPDGADFDTLAGARKNPYTLDIYAAAGPGGNFALMPPAGLAPTLQERTWLGQWVACGQPE